MNKFIGLVAGSLVLLSCGEKESFVSGNQLVGFGRTEVADARLELISSASHVGFTFEGSACRVYLSLSDWQDHNYIQYEVDGIYQGRVRINKTDALPLTIQSDKNGSHTVWLYKATEAHTGPVYVDRIAGSGVKVVERKQAPLIEFIGNSITCGAAADPSDVPCGAGDYHDQHNAYFAYGPRVARALGANFILSSVSGIGIYRNWNSDGPDMPEVFHTSDFQLESKRLWNFDRYHPDIVSIALGTNDFSGGDGTKPRLPFDSVAFVESYISFVEDVKSKYSEAHIVLLSSAMVQGDNRKLFEKCLSAVKEKIDALHPTDRPVTLYFFKSMQASGCTGHPDVEDHGVLAEELIPVFRTLIDG